MKDKICEHCNHSIATRNPSGYCDHLYYPDNCKVCKAREDRKKKKVPWTMEGNKGGDYLLVKIVDEKLGLMHIECGHCCVKSVDYVLPIEIVCHIITDSFLHYTGEHGMSAEDMIKGSNWPERFKNEMLERMKKWVR